MGLKELKAYVKHVYELEVSVYQQEQLAEKIKTAIDEVPKKPTTDENRFPRGKKIARIIVIIGLVVSLALICKGVVDYQLERYNYYLERHPDYLAREGTWFGWEYFVTGYPLLHSLPLILSLCGSAILRIQIWCDEEKYQKQLADYMFGQKQRRIWQAELIAVQEKLAETRAVLKEFYNTPDEDDDRYIHSDYQDLIAVSYFYQLLDHKQESTLPRCYDRYDEAKYRNEIITILGAILQNLNQIRITQTMLYQAVTRSNEINEGIYNELVSLNDTGAQISGKLDGIDRSNRLMAHNSELARQEAEHHRFLEELRNG